MPCCRVVLGMGDAWWVRFDWSLLPVNPQREDKGYGLVTNRCPDGMTSHRVVQPTGRRVARGITPIPRTEPHASHQHHRTRRPAAGDYSPTHLPAPENPGPGPTATGQRVTGDDGTLTSIVDPGSPIRIFTSCALRLPSPAPPQTTVLRDPPFAVTVKETWSAVDTDTPETYARSDGSSDPRAPRAASTPAGALPTVRKVNPSRSTTSTSP